MTRLPGVTPAITYDPRGNVTYDGHFHYTWDAQDRLIAAQVTYVVKFEFGYDSEGRRTWKKSFGWANNDWQLAEHLIFAYDGWNLLAEFKVTGGQPTLYRSYSWGINLGGGIGGLLSITDHSATGSPTYYPFYDGNGNVMGLSDANGTVVATYQYDPFGQLVESTGPAATVNPFRFSTKYFDADTGLYYYGYRYYSPQLQRWMSRDPIEESGGMNLYAFVGNDPVNHLDPLGMDRIEAKWEEGKFNVYYVDEPSKWGLWSMGINFALGDSQAVLISARAGRMDAAFGAAGGSAVGGPCQIPDLPMLLRIGHADLNPSRVIHDVPIGCQIQTSTNRYGSTTTSLRYRFSVRKHVAICDDSRKRQKWRIARNNRGNLNVRCPY